MSVGIDISRLSPEFYEQLLKLLTVYPEESYFQKKLRKWKKFKQDDDTPATEPVSMYIIKDNIIFIPYYTYEILFKTKANLDKWNLGLYPSTGFIFTQNLYESQIPTCNELITKLVTNGTANLNVYTGGGKTVMCAYASAMLKVKTIVFVSNTQLIIQWVNTYKIFTNAKVFIVDTPSATAITTGGNNDPPPDVDVVICMCTRVESLSRGFLCSIGLVIIDEAHTFCSVSRVPALLSCQPKYVIAATATLEREADGMHTMIFSICGTERIFKKSVKPFNVMLYNTGCAVEIPKTRFGDPDWTGLVGRLCNDEQRNSFLIDIIRLNVNHKIVVLTARQKHVIQLNKSLGNLGIKSDFLTGKKDEYKNSTVLVGTVKKIGTGFDEKMSCPDFDGINIDLLVIAISIKSESLLQQVIGRAFRAQFPSIIALYDANSISDNHMKKNRKFFESVRGNVMYVESPLCKAFPTTTAQDSHLAKYLK